MEEIEDLIARATPLDANVEQRNAAFGELVKRFQDMAYGCAYAVLGDVQLAEDAAQEAFITAYRNLNQLQEPTAFGGWLRRIVLTECNRITRKTGGIAEPIEAALDVPSAEKDPAEIAENREMKDRVLAAIKALPAGERMATTLFYIDGYSQKEIAEFLEVPVMTVKNRLRSSRKRLKGRMVDMVQDYIYEKRPSQDDQFANKVRLFTAVREGDVDTAKALLKEAPGLVNVRENMLESFLARSRIAYGTPHQKKYLRKLEKEEGWTPLHWAAWIGQIEMAKLLIANDADVNPMPDKASGEGGITPLYWAARNGHKGVAELLLANGADVNAKAKRGQTPLHFATALNQKDVTKLLLANGADVNAVTHSGCTPLHYAAINGYQEVAAILIANRADINAKDNGGRTPKDWAEHNNHTIKRLSCGAQESVLIPLAEKVLGCLLAVNDLMIRELEPINDAGPEEDIDADEALETGIKVIDLLAPIVHGGKISIFGGAGVGCVVTAAELMHNAATHHGGYSVYVDTEERHYESQELMLEFWEGGVADKMAFVIGQMSDLLEVRQKAVETGLTLAEHFRKQSGVDVLCCVANKPPLSVEIERLQARFANTKRGAITALLLTSDGSYRPPDDGPRFDNFDGKLAFSHVLREQGLYPTIDPLASHSRILKPEVVGEEHYQVACQVKEILTRYRDLHEIVERDGIDGLSDEDRQIVVRARRIQRFFTQPFRVAQIYTNTPGEYVPLAETIRGFQGIVEGEYDNLPEEAFRFVGGIDQVVEKAKTLKA